MRIFFDVLTGDELLNDSYPMEFVDNFYYEVEGKNIIEGNNVDDKLFAGNVTSEDNKPDNVDGGVLPSTGNGIDIVLNHKLVEIHFDKSSFGEWLKDYSNKLHKYVKEYSPDRVSAFETGIIKLAKEIASKFNQYRFYRRKSNKIDGMVVLQFDQETTSTPVFIYFKDGLREEKR